MKMLIISGDSAVGKMTARQIKEAFGF